MGRRVAAALLAVLLLSTLNLSSVLAKGGGKSSGGGSSSVSGGSTSVRSGTRVYGSSYGSGRTVRIVAVVVIVSFVFIGGHNYQAVRYNYGTYYDDCALRNVTAAQTGGNDWAVDINSVNSLPTTAAALGYGDIFQDMDTYNRTLYNTTGTIVDPQYCNYTQTASDGSSRGHRMSVPLVITAGFGAAALAARPHL